METQVVIWLTLRNQNAVRINIGKPISVMKKKLINHFKLNRLVVHALLSWVALKPEERPENIAEVSFGGI